jgi:D-alanyl-D-alanine carboxypeptidase
VLLLRLDVLLDESVRAWFDDPRLPDASLRRLLDHTSGIPDYTRLPEYKERELDHDAWPDEELLDRALALGSDFPAGEGWAYSNTGYLLLRLIVERVAGFERALRNEILEPLGLRETTVALEPIRLGDHTYDPRWVGHRTLVATAADVHRFWLAVARSELVPLERLTESVWIGEAVPGYVRPSYGLGVMYDPEWPHGPLVGHGGGGPGATAAAFVVLREQPLIAVVLSDDSELPAETRAHELLTAAIRDGR